MVESSPFLVPQKATSKSLRAAHGKTRTLPADLLAEAARRLSWAGFVYAGFWGAYLLLVPFLKLKDVTVLKSIGVPFTLRNSPVGM